MVRRPFVPLTRFWRISAVALALIVWPFARGAVLHAQLDICGCNGNPASNGDFDTANPTPAQQALISSSAQQKLEIVLPADGVLVFNSLNLRPRTTPNDFGTLTITFKRNAANTPVMLLVSGDVTIASGVTLSVSGENGTSGTPDVLGNGGRGGPGGYPGGDGSYQLVNFGTNGGAGLGPGGGGGGTGSYLSGNAFHSENSGGNGMFVGSNDLLPLVGGSGGGGGASNMSTYNGIGCTGGGGGGGGGALLIAANGNLTINGQAMADGGAQGNYYHYECASSGGPGSGGAVRLLANTISGSGHVYARGPSGFNGPSGAGKILMEALNNTMTVGSTDPVATRLPGPGPLANVVNPSVAITAVGGQPVPSPPQGVFRGVDVLLAVPGSTSIDLATSGVPSGTTVNVTIKPRVGSAAMPAPQTIPVPVTGCDGSGACLFSTTVSNLPAGAYIVEARATFQTP